MRQPSNYMHKLVKNCNLYKKLGNSEEASVSSVDLSVLGDRGGGHRGG